MSTENPKDNGANSWNVKSIMAEFIPTGIGGLKTRVGTRKKIEKAAGRSYERRELARPPRPLYNVIPSQEDIESLIDRAVAAIAKGIYWDRGSIINLVL